MARNRGTQVPATVVWSVATQTERDILQAMLAGTVHRDSVPGNEVTLRVISGGRLGNEVVLSLDDEPGAEGSNQGDPDASEGTPVQDEPMQED